MSWELIRNQILKPSSRPVCMCWGTRLCLTLCEPMDCSPPGSSVHGISQAGILEWVAISFSKGYSQPKDRMPSPALKAGSFTTGTSLVAQLRIYLQCRRLGFDPWVGKIPWRRESLPTPVFWPREFHGLSSPWSCKELEITEQLSLSLSVQYLETYNILKHTKWKAQWILNGFYQYAIIYK